MKIEEAKKLPVLDRLIHWIEERERIRKRKERGDKKPWTDDVILRSFRFCNVIRMDDKVSKWLLENWYEPEFNHPNILPAVVLARHFNLPKTLEAIGFPIAWEPDRMKRVLQLMKDNREKIFNAAYIIASNGEPNKAEMVVNLADHFVRRPPNLNTGSMKKASDKLTQYKGFGYFMAGQVVCDLRWAMEGEWKDKQTWGPVGPGSIRGLNRLFGRDVKKQIDKRQFDQDLRKMRDLCQSRLRPSLLNRMEGIDYENCMCEFDKWERALWGQGKPKQKYRGI